MAKGGSCILLIKGRDGSMELDTVFFLEFVDAAAGIQELLLTREERVTSGTDLYTQVLFDRT